MKKNIDKKFGFRIMAIALSLTLVGGVIFSAVYGLFSSNVGKVISSNDAEIYDNTSENSDEEFIENEAYSYPDIRDLINDDIAAKIVDMHYNIDQYEGKEETMVAQFFMMDGVDDRFLIGVFDTLDDGENLLFSIISDYNNGEIPEGLENFDWVEVTGVVGLSDLPHEDHSHSEPTLFVSEIRKLEDEEVETMVNN